MAVYSSSITFNGVTLNVKSLTPIRKQKTRKAVIGRTLVEIKVIGLNAQQWELQISGIITGSSVSDLSTKRAAIETLDDTASHAFVDGIHDSVYFLKPESLTFSDDGEYGGLSYQYSFILIEE